MKSKLKIFFSFVGFVLFASITPISIGLYLLLSNTYSFTVGMTLFGSGVFSLFPILNMGFAIYDNYYKPQKLEIRTKEQCLI